MCFYKPKDEVTNFLTKGIRSLVIFVILGAGKCRKMFFRSFHMHCTCSHVECYTLIHIFYFLIAFIILLCLWIDLFSYCKTCYILIDSILFHSHLALNMFDFILAFNCFMYCQFLKRFDCLASTFFSLFLIILSSDANSWEKVMALLVQVASHGEHTCSEVPCLIVRAKDDLDPSPVAIQDSMRVCHCSLSISPPCF